MVKYSTESSAALVTGTHTSWLMVNAGGVGEGGSEALYDDPDVGHALLLPALVSAATASAIFPVCWDLR